MVYLLYDKRQIYYFPFFLNSMIVKELTERNEIENESNVLTINIATSDTLKVPEEN